MNTIVLAFRDLIPIVFLIIIAIFFVEHEKRNRRVNQLAISFQLVMVLFFAATAIMTAIMLSYSVEGWHPIPAVREICTLFTGIGNEDVDYCLTEAM